MFLSSPVPQNRPFELEFHSDATTGGATLLVLGWVPKEGAAVPGSETLVIAPAATQKLNGTVPSFAAASRLELRVDVPDGRAKCTLVLRVDSAVHSRVSITQDVSLTALVRP